MKRRIAAILASAGIALGVFAAPADAVPGPGESNQCAPGQHGNQDPGFKPGSC